MNSVIFSQNQQCLKLKSRVLIALKWEINRLSVFKTLQIIFWYYQNKDIQLFLMNAYFSYTAHCAHCNRSNINHTFWKKPCHSVL